MSGTATSEISLPEGTASGSPIRNRPLAPATATQGLPEERLHIVNYTTEFRAPVAWLTDVEKRIRNSIFPRPQVFEGGGEWLTPSSAQAALAFVRSASDYLPCEPSIHGTEEGNFVAEFQTALVRLTTLVTDHSTVLFGYRRDGNDAPLDLTIASGSNRIREQVRQFGLNLGVLQDGENLEADS
jgi:hypothetical protein